MGERVVSEDAEFTVVSDSDSDIECMSIASGSDSDDDLPIPVESAKLVNDRLGELALQDPEPSMSEPTQSRVVSDAAADTDVIVHALGVDADHDSIKESYRFQSFHILAQYPVPTWISEQVNDEWKRIITSHAIVELNTAAPGIHLHIVTDKRKARIRIYNATEDPLLSKSKKFSAQKQAQRAYTRGNVLHYSKRWNDRVSSELPIARVYLGNDFKPHRYKRTSVHEILHALGFKHEHKRKGANKELEIVSKDEPDRPLIPEHKCKDAEQEATTVNKGKLDERQLKPEKNVHGLTRFDPFSIMMYSEGGEGDPLKRTDHADPVWKHKKSGDLNQELSELDKVALNLFYPPREHSGYKPKWNPATNTYYCSRKVMATHNRPDGPVCDGFCGGDPSKTVKEGPNCPACRTLKSPDGATLPLDESRWQGWSGMIYCGKNGCGPDFGQPCQECKKLLYPGQ